MWLKLSHYNCGSLPCCWSQREWNGEGLVIKLLALKLVGVGCRKNKFNLPEKPLLARLHARLVLAATTKLNLKLILELSK